MFIFSSSFGNKNGLIQILDNIKTNILLMANNWCQAVTRSCTGAALVESKSVFTNELDNTGLLKATADRRLMRFNQSGGQEVWVDLQRFHQVGAHVQPEADDCQHAGEEVGWSAEDTSQHG